MTALERHIPAKRRDRIDQGTFGANRTVISAEPIVCDGWTLKWYDLLAEDGKLEPEAIVLARATAYAMVDVLPPEIDATGFVIHHICGGAVYLVLSVWRHGNELWEQVLMREVDSSRFEIFEGMQNWRHTHCLWQLAIVAHEADAWTQYLSDGESLQARQRWLDQTASDELLTSLRMNGDPRYDR